MFPFQVRLGYNRVTGERVAVKIITKNESQKGFNTKRIFQEVNVQKVCAAEASRNVTSPALCRTCETVPSSTIRPDMTPVCIHYVIIR